MKKKKKTLYIRTNRIRFDKKRTIKFYEAEHFLNKFIIHFRRKINIMKKKNFIRFLKRFQSTNFNKVYNYIKIFGMNRSYKFNNFYYRSERSDKLFLKFKIKKVKKNYLKKKKKEIENLQKKHFLLFFQPINFKKNNLK